MRSSGRRPRSYSGMVLVFVLLVSVVLIILIFSILMTSQYGLRAKIRSEALAIAEAGIEFVRGSLQENSVPSSSQYLTGHSQQLFYLNGQAVKFPNVEYNGVVFSSVAGEDAWGIEVKDKDGNTRGFFAYEMVGTDPIHCYSMGCVGPASNQLEPNRRIIIHVQLKPYTYSEFTKFFGNPCQPINFTGAYKDPFYGTDVYSGVGNSPPDTKVSDWLNPGGTLQSFSKTFVAGDFFLSPSINSNGNNIFRGFSMGSYYSPRDDASSPPRPTRVREGTGETVYVNEKMGLYGIKKDEMGLPTSSGTASKNAQIQIIMDNLKDIAKGSNNKGIYIEGNRTILGDLVHSDNGIKRASAVWPLSNRIYYGTADDNMYDWNGDTNKNPFKNKFLTAKEDWKNRLATEYGDCVDVAENKVKGYGQDTDSNGEPDYYPYDPSNVTKTYWEKPGTSTSSTDWFDDYRSIDPTDDFQNREYVVKFYKGSGGEGRVTISNISKDYINSGGNESGMWKIMKDGTNLSYSSSLDYAISDINSNPTVKIIYLRGNARIYGVVKGKITVVAEGKITIGRNGTTGGADLVYDGINSSSAREGTKPRDLSLNANPNVLGLFSPRKIIIDPGIERDGNPTNPSCPSETDVNKFAICATMMAGGSPPQITDPSDIFDPNVGQHGNNSIVAGKFTICAKQKASGDPNAAYWGSTQDWSKISFYGSSICFHRNKNYRMNYANVYDYYDDRLLTTQPPYFPTMSAGWNIVYWAEVHIDEGKDIRYKRAVY